MHIVLYGRGYVFNIDIRLDFDVGAGNVRRRQASDCISSLASMNGASACAVAAMYIGFHKSWRRVTCG
jgi:hypothetical protein